MCSGMKWSLIFPVYEWTSCGDGGATGKARGSTEMVHTIPEAGILLLRLQVGKGARGVTLMLLWLVKCKHRYEGFGPPNAAH